MAKGNTGNTKEFAQCLAFAHFAVIPYNANEAEQHKKAFYDIFLSSKDQQETGVERPKLIKYRNHLGGGFQFRSTINEFKSKYNSKKDTITAHTTVQKVYDVALSLYTSKVVGQNWEIYEFLDQTDKFTTTVKDEALNKIKQVFGLTFRLDMLASFDVFIVHKQKKQQILSEINQHIVNADDATILSNYCLNRHTYRTILNRHFASKSNTRSLVAVSLKLPGTVEQKKYINIIGTKNVRKEVSDYIDPYTKFMTLAYTATSSQLKSLIENLIKIEYGQFKVSPSVLTWELPVTFRYRVAAQKVFGRDIEPLSDMNYKIIFLAQGYGAGWNGFVAEGHQGPPWTGGGGVSTFEHFYEQYREYSTVIQKLVHMRAKAFNYVLTGRETSGSTDTRSFSTKLKNLHRKATQDLLTKKILSTVKQSKSLMDFFKAFDEETGRVNTATAYQVALINLVRKQVSPSIKISDRYASFTMKDMIPNPNKKTPKDKDKIQISRLATPQETDDRIEAHYVHAQLAWFAFIGGKNFQTYLKQRMFLTIYGVISKKGYKIFDYDNNLTTIKSAITAEVKGVPRAAFDSAPHLLLS
jgi:hypothetical protein